MPAPFTTPVAFSIPFEPNRNGSDIEAENVQEAIEEAKQDAINNDRFILLCQYGGNANTGRNLEFFSGLSSNVAPIFLAASAKCLSLVVASTATVTTSVSFFDLNVSSTIPIYTASLAAQNRIILTGTPLLPLFITAANCQLSVRVTAGSINNPHVYFTLSANT